MAGSYILDTADWLCQVEAQGGGWGIQPNDEAGHPPISGEVAYALWSVADREGVQAKLAELQAYFSTALEDVVPRSVVHLCWTVLGSLACGISANDERVKGFLERLGDSYRDGWAWSFPNGEEDPRAVYPTYLALLTLAQARTKDHPSISSFESAGIWLLALRQSDLLWGNAETATPGQRVLESAYAILGLYHVLSSEQFRESVPESLAALSEAALNLERDQGVVIEQPLTSSPLPPWHHCVIPQVVWTRLRILGLQGELDESPISELITKCVTDMWHETNRTWMDPSRNFSTPYLAADMLRVFAAYSSEVHRQHVAPELAVRMIAHTHQAAQYAAEVEALKTNVVVLDPATIGNKYDYHFSWRYVGMSSRAYGMMSLMTVALLVTLGFLGIPSTRTITRVGIIAVGVLAYPPLQQALRVEGRERKFDLVVGIVAVVGVIFAIGIGWIFR